MGIFYLPKTKSDVKNNVKILISLGRKMYDSFAEVIYAIGTTISSFFGNGEVEMVLRNKLF